MTKDTWNVAERPAEVCGARWAQDVDHHENGTTTIGNARTLTYAPERPRRQLSVVVEKDAKSEAGERALPLPLPTWLGLKAFGKIQVAERLAAGDAYEATGYAMVDKLGRPWKTDKLRREAYRLLDQLEARRVTPYMACHAIPVVDGEQRRAGRRGVGVGRPRGPVLHAADLCAP
ncbi:hypothetical protein ACIBCC_10545 [Streptomyces griseus]|uniref:hypothetical protein n=1 Tax=Streptomyces TaxID=1883 RepID=UPI0011D198DF|nr:hypothetical protein [Streptomyces sp. ACT-1]MYR51198.1 hypothetical protein [Streptomyces sp. SID4928]